ncbi:hypothetical protein [Mycobacteroides abscessus]|uniref:hypothetical protein n=1 Tax=Mycobacteroides abscessus TaxID=36809 RepID=UPI000926DBF1|nr:hypothetical protein [Mycobacteroides abscessus]SHQ04785.1 Uncharacterised protein [Mycobacteroides abscessus subsp. abscessus]SHQ70511.1 Uncharacterised protein [Mycobacteroides abscessus subsp. abscessus]SHQ84288.1 Uncharacterised protein [Mycobacteroides abscessus subsp. abscessus]SHQ86729.1 Uncharacterised protein [Mycobacteroides abscessus subsp. abscessus]SHQ88626.1 Uncharacterised protein [Mycobacteroides abscessus subsp. abscessus]
MADDGWSGRSHADIVAKLSALKSENAYNLGNTWSEIYTDLSDAADKHDLARRQLATEGFWTGKGPAAALRTLTVRTTEFDDSETGTPALAGKMGNALTQDGEVLRAAKHVAEEHPELGSGAPTQRKKEELEALRNEAQRLYTTPLEAKRPEITDNAGQPMGGSMPQGPGGNSSGGGSNSSGADGSQNPQSPSGSDGLANKDTKPQLAGGEGQQAGAGQGQGGGQGAGSGGGAPGSGTGAGGSGAGLGSGAKDSGTGLPVGATTAAGFSPSATGTGPGGGPGAGVASGGLSGLRGGGLPGGATSGTGPGGANPAGVSAAGVRSIGGPMGMMGGAGAHGKGGKGEHDDEHATPELLKNLDNSEEWLGERRTFIPGGVLGDFKAAEDADRQALEAEKRRFKSIGWNVKFSDEEDGGKR